MSVGEGKAAEYRLKLNTAALTPTVPACGDLGREKLAHGNREHRTLIRRWKRRTQAELRSLILSGTMNIGQKRDGRR